MCWLTDTPVCGIINYFFKSSTYFKAIVWYVVKVGKKQILHLTLHLNSSYIAVPWGDMVSTCISSSCRVKREKRFMVEIFWNVLFHLWDEGLFSKGGQKKMRFWKGRLRYIKMIASHRYMVWKSRPEFSADCPWMSFPPVQFFSILIKKLLQTAPVITVHSLRLYNC